jgi:dienelactone hydrolase
MSKLDNIAVASSAAVATQRQFRRRFATGALFGLALCATQAAFAQAPAANTAVVGPKQVGFWSLTGWSQGYCSAERPLRGAAGVLHFVMARGRAGYIIALSAPEWELTPQTTFPVELDAGPLHKSATAIATTPKVVAIQLGTDNTLTGTLARAPMVEIKAAQETFKLPLEGFAAIVAELDTCFASLKQPVTNPFAAPAAPAPATPKPTAAPAAPVAPKPTPAVAKPAAAPSPAPATAASAARDNDLVEERTFLTVPGAKGPYRLEAFIVRPANAEGRLPIVLITHGKNPTPAENQALRADMMRPQARDFAARGWLAVVVMRRGYGQSDGLPGVSRGAPYMTCENSDLVRGFDTEADDLVGALQALRARPDADGTRVIAIGQSLGGGTVLACAARRPVGLLGVVNISGGVWRSGGGKVCDTADLVEAMATFGSRTAVPTLWLYAENDSLFPPALVNRMRDAFVQAGGRADLHMFPPVLGDGHALFMDFSARVKWLRTVDTFLQANRMPNANFARVDEVMRAAKLATNARAVVEEYFSTPAPKLLVATASGRGAYWVANPTDIVGARKRVLERCREQSGADCTVVMENNQLVRPMVTGAAPTDVTAR